LSPIKHPPLGNRVLPVFHDILWCQILFFVDKDLA
jgi:hypothetical protein